MKLTTGNNERSLKEAHGKLLKKMEGTIYQFQLELVAFDKKGRTHRFRDLPGKKRKRSQWLPALVAIDEDKKVVEWYGPIWFSDPDRSGKKRYLNHIDLVRMTWYASEEARPCPTVSFTRSEVGEELVYYYWTPGGRVCKVPILLIDDEPIAIYEIGFR